MVTLTQNRTCLFLLPLAAAIGFCSLSGCGFTNTKGTTSTTSGPTSGSPTETGTGTGGGTTTVTPATYAQVSQQIFQPICIGCHNAGGRQPDLSSYAGFATNTQYIIPGNAGSSLIYTITVSGQMPEGETALTSTQLQLLASWIDAGAPND